MEERRLAPRCEDIPIVVHQCVVSYMGKEHWLQAGASDLSALGVSLELADSLNSGESIYLLMTVKPDGREPRELSVNGVAAYCRPLDNGKWRVGVQFLDLSEADQALWADYLQC